MGFVLSLEDSRAYDKMKKGMSKNMQTLYRYLISLLLVILVLVIYLCLIQLQLQLEGY